MRYLFVLLLCSTWAHTFATTYYVSNSGANSNLGLSWADAFSTLQKAADLVGPGDCVLVADGTYAGFDLRDTDGTAAAPIAFVGQGDNVVINMPGPIRQDGINVEGVDHVEINRFKVVGMVNGGNGIRIVLADHCSVRNCICDQNDERGIFTGFTDDILIENNICTNSIDEHGIYVSNSSDRPIIRYNECYGNNAIGIHMNGDVSAGGDGIISDAQVYGNLLHDNNQAAGINMDGCLNPLVYNNLIYNNHFAQGIALFQEDGAMVTQGAKIFNNTIIVPSDGRWGILLRDGSNLNTEIYNNIIINQHAWRGCIAADEIDQLTSDHNILQDKMSNDGDGSTITLSEWQALDLDENSQLADPLTDLFVDSTNNDFRLQANAQAIDAGTSVVSNFVGTDLDGKFRPLGVEFDIGCYEYGAGVCMAIVLSPDEIEVMPAAPSDLWSISGSTNVFTIRILNSSGQLYDDLTVSPGPIFIDQAGLPPGRYYLEVFGLVNESCYFRKIIKY